MLRISILSFSIVWLFLCTSARLSALPPEPDAHTSLKNSLAVQRALQQARHYMYESKPERAVEVLEAQLPRINGNAIYLRTLGDAYRAHIKNLYLEKKKTLAKYYLERLCIIDEEAANDPALTGHAKPAQVAAPAPKPIQPAVKPATLPAQRTETKVAAPKEAFAVEAIRPASHQEKTPGWQPLTALSSTAAPIKPSAAVEPAPVFRGKVATDPFSLANQLNGSAEQSLAQRLQAEGLEKFAQNQYRDARRCFEKAYQADPRTMAATGECWAICILQHVRERGKRANLTNVSLEELRRLVPTAIAMAPRLNEEGGQLLRDLNGRQGADGLEARPPGTDGNAEPAAAIQHAGRSIQGWQSAESAHFRVLYHQQSRAFVEKVLQTAEKTRVDMFRKWFDHEGVRWDEKCDLFLHDTLEEYCRTTNATRDSPGHAVVKMDEQTKRVQSRRIDLHCEQSGVLETVLPRETTLVVLAGMFGSVKAPRWANVGMAVLSESPGRVGQHRRNLLISYQEGSLFSVRELLQMKGYPDNKDRIRAFYAQSILLVEFLSSQRSPTVFTQFLRDGARDGFEAALQRHYQWTLNDLDSHWAQYVLAESTRLAKGD